MARVKPRDRGGRGRWRPRGIIVAILLALRGALAGPLSAQNVAGDARALRDDAVRITTTFADGSPSEPGFGIILRESADTLYIATAGHVVVSRFSAKTDEIRVAFRDKPDERVATLVRESRDRDLALIKVVKPPGFNWRFRGALGFAKVGARVAIIGRNRQWQPTGNAVAGAISQIDRGEIVADFAGAEAGASGGPLVGGGGIIGLVYQDSGNEVYAYDIEVVRRLLLADWLGLTQLDPPDFPFAAVSLTSGLVTPVGGVISKATHMPPPGYGLAVDVALSELLGIGVEVDHSTTDSGRYDDVASGRTWIYRNPMNRAELSLIFHSNRFRGSGQYASIGLGRLWMRPSLRIDDGPFIRLEEVPGAAPVSGGDAAWAITAGAGMDKVWASNLFAALELRIDYTTTPYVGVTIQDPFSAQTGNDWMFGLRLRLGYMLRPSRSKLRIIR